MKNVTHEIVDTLSRLIAFPSVSSVSNVEVTECVAEMLRSLGFETEVTTYVDFRGVEKANVLAKRMPSGATGSPAGGLAYFAHTDVVPANDWTGAPQAESNQGASAGPFDATIVNDRVYGRGSCDMKGSLAAFLAAVKQVPRESQTRPLWVVCTADEETGFHGARHLVHASAGFREIVEAQPLAIIGEPTELRVIHAHKGITGFRIISHGRAGHSSTNDGVNANVAMVPMLQKIAELHQRTLSEARYQDARFDPPTLSWNFGFTDHGSAINVTPPRSEAWVSLRTMPGIDGNDLIDEARSYAASLGLEFKALEGGDPVWVDADDPCIRAMCELAGGTAATKCYSTDGGQFSELSQRLVCGPGNIAQAHTADEWVSIDQLGQGADLYRRAIEHWCQAE
ncbi:Acetylornithine deacetylase [Novipirellula galeiformis]|uniref:Acetylornithine deacetylase n=1 Tax=Novipirellula galeiformis TaxID=2528004 RepID=A0A5C6CL41_9BACT|nr:M20 family metallopeptidase [Novipirellula galeiformis]TWU24277.1 Acetylornithine deacetylase [Novipirellula galeiformis]